MLMQALSCQLHHHMLYTIIQDYISIYRTEGYEHQLLLVLYGEHARTLPRITSASLLLPLLLLSTRITSQHALIHPTLLLV
jgi:hypothetical protein